MTFRRCEQLAPYQMRIEAITANLQRLISVIERLSDADGTVIARTARALSRRDLGDLGIGAVRPAGLQAHRLAGSIEPVARDLERMSLVLDSAASTADLEIGAPVRHHTKL